MANHNAEAISNRNSDRREPLSFAEETPSAIAQKRLQQLVASTLLTQVMQRPTVSSILTGRNAERKMMARNTMTTAPMLETML